MIFRSPYPDVSIPNVSLPEFLFHGIEARKDATAFVEGASGRVVTYGQLWSGIRQAAAGLHKRGLKKGEVVAIYSPNVPEYAMAWHGVALAGGINTTANPLYTPDELAFQLRDAKARFLITAPSFLEKATEAARKAGGIEEIFVFGDTAGATPFAALLDNDGQMPEVKIDPKKDLVALPYSSGTTGLPKGVMLTHHNLVANISQFEVMEPLYGNDTLVGILPFFHIYGMVVILNAGLRHGARIVTMARFELEPFLKLVQTYKVTRAHLVPPIVLALTKHPAVAQYDLSSIQVIISGAAPLGAELAQACAQRLGCKVKQGYGMTEASPVTHLNPDEKIRPGAAGVLIPNTVAKVVSTETGQPVDKKQNGEIWLRGPQVMQGYHNWPDNQRDIIDAEGYLHTGDVGYVDDDGYFFIVDRVKELIKYKGLQIAPAELEALLVTHPAIADAAVIPSPDEEAGEVPKAFVVLKSPVPLEQIVSFVAERVAPHKKLRLIEAVDAIPKSSSGKILRRMLVERERERRRAQPQG